MSSRIGRTLALVFVAGGLATAASAQSISTTFANNNGGSAGGIVFFDIVVGPSPITITSVGVNTSAVAATTFGFTMYTKNGTYVGSEQTAANWAVATTGVGTAAGVGTASSVALGGAVVLAANTTYGVGLVLASTGQTSAAHAYTNGTGANQTYTNADLTLNLGAAQNIPFTGVPFTPRVWNGTINYTLGGTLGACCLGAPTYACIQTTATNCTAQGGTYAGDNITCAAANCPPPPTGRCCTEAGSCSVITQLACTASGGVYGGNNTTCAAACVPFGYTETGDAGELPGTSQTISGPSGASLNVIHGTIATAGDTDMYQVEVCNAANFSATTVGGTTIDTIMAMFKADGHGVSFNDDEVGGTTLQSRITSTFVSPAGNGNYYLAVGGWNHIPVGATGQIWINDGVASPYRSERAPDGPGAADVITGWTVSTSTATGAYNIALTGTCFVGGSTCYANCDGSSVPPILNSLDFGCFLTKFAAGDTYANCDGSSVPPTLNSLDFGCFLTKFAAGCT